MTNLYSMLFRGVLGKCPNCGKHPLFTGYLKQIKKCNYCNASFEAITADDAPAWLTIIIVGHLLIPFVIKFNSSSSMPDWLIIVMWVCLVIVFSLLILPRSKGFIIALLWYLRNGKKQS